MKREIKFKIETFAKKYCDKSKEDPFLWKEHTQFVKKYSLKLAKIENANRDVLIAASLLHDIGKDKGRKDHNVRGYELSKKFLKNIDIEDKELILKCILKHSSKFSKENNETEVKVIQCADALAVLFDDRWQKYSRENYSKKELLFLYNKTFNKINLKSAKKIAEPQIKKLKKFIP